MIETTTEEPTMTPQDRHDQIVSLQLALDLPYALDTESVHLQDFVLEIVAWDADTKRSHVAAMIRRNLIHDDPGCLDTAYIAQALLDGTTVREAVKVVDAS
jgi:hypothetical protein